MSKTIIFIFIIRSILFLLMTILIRLGTNISSVSKNYTTYVIHLKSIMTHFESLSVSKAHSDININYKKIKKYIVLYKNIY